jgi:hypothetical protein
MQEEMVAVVIIDFSPLVPYRVSNKATHVHAPMRSLLLQIVEQPVLGENSEVLLQGGSISTSDRDVLERGKVLRECKCLRVIDVIHRDLSDRAPEINELGSFKWSSRDELPQEVVTA